jgi:hypothetical protein
MNEHSWKYSLFEYPSGTHFGNRACRLCGVSQELHIKVIYDTREGNTITHEERPQVGPCPGSKGKP